jgi:hypothetical protein
MKCAPCKIRVVECEPLPEHHLEASKDLVRRAALRQARQMQEAQRKS